MNHHIATFTIFNDLMEPGSNDADLVPAVVLHTGGNPPGVDNIRGRAILPCLSPVGFGRSLDDGFECCLILRGANAHTHMTPSSFRIDTAIVSPCQTPGESPVRL